MNYATQQDLIDRFGADELLQLTDRNNVGQIDAVAVNRALGDADAEINGYLAGRYTLPLATVPAIVQRVACDLALYQLYGNRVTDPVRQRYVDAVGLLKSIGSGSVQLGVATGQAASADPSGVSVITSARVFGHQQLADF
ncbi:gp436 family protein [Chitinimonas sp.]|uniref:gp436 family protein n=1 Tax=Chitinimonas sp. TaxID=1934313 RepID=UPI0035B0B750